jgi:hypothetical protein
VERVAVDGREATREELLQAKPAEPPAPPPPVVPAKNKFRGVMAHAPIEEAPPIAPRQTVRSIAADVLLANWDNDIEQDGLRLTVYPRDRAGEPVVAGGALEVELFAPEIRDFNAAPHGRGATLERIGRWTVNVSAADWTGQGLTYELPFQAIHPQFDREIGYWGVVDVRLIVPGDGVFETRLDYVRIRPFSPLLEYYGRGLRRRNN